MIIIPMERKHWSQVQRIYQEGIDTQQATFETTAPDWKDWNNNHLPLARLVAIDNAMVLGWAALSPVSRRAVYKGVAELSIYIDIKQLGKGLGRRLMLTLISSSEENGIWTLQSSLFPENKASVCLHEKFGFRKVGVREKIAQQHGVWRDAVIYERRSDNF